MTVRPKPYPNVNPTNRSKSYHNDKLGYQRLLIACKRPDFRDQDVLTSLRWLMENDH